MFIMMIIMIIITVIMVARVMPPPNDAPTATPSEIECTVITTTIRITLRASAPLMSLIVSSRPCRSFWVRRMNPTPSKAPAPVCKRPYSPPSATSPKQAPSISPAAIALA